MTISGRIRDCLLRGLEDPVRIIGDQLYFQPDTGVGREANQKKAIQDLDVVWRGALGIDSLKEKWKNYRTLFIFTICGLNTTAIVTTLTPSLTEYNVVYEPVIPDASYAEWAPEPLRPCTGIAPNGTTLSSAYFWSFNGSFFYVANDQACPPALVKPLASGINTDNVDDHVYVDLGVAVDRSAIGASFQLYQGPVFKNFTNQYTTSLVTTVQCVPVMKSNPIQCQQGGIIEIVDDHTLHIASEESNPDNVCFDVGSQESFARNLNTDSVMISAMVSNSPNEFYGPDMIGMGCMVFGAYTDPHGATPFASYLAGAVNDPQANSTEMTSGNATYAVTCSIDPRNSFEYRLVTLDLQAIGKGKESNAAYYLSAGDVCTPTNPTVNWNFYATAMAANINLVRDQFGLDGYFATIASLAKFLRGPPYAFNNSRNAMEDVLGLGAALAVSRIPILTNTSGIIADATGDGGGRAYATVQASRLGSDSSEGLVLLVPPLISLILMAVLFVLSFRDAWQLGGRKYARLSFEERPKQYAAQSLYELMTPGRLLPLLQRYGYMETSRNSCYEFDDLQVNPQKDPDLSEFDDLEIGSEPP